VGKVSFSAEKIVENTKALIDAIIKAKPATAKGRYVRKMNVASTMGPGILLNPGEFGA
jgi:large subunit ribosomal protein L1